MHDKDRFMITGNQVRDACALLTWSRYDLNRKTGLPFQQVDRILSSAGEINATTAERIILMDAFSRAGIEITSEGVRLRKADAM